MISHPKVKLPFGDICVWHSRIAFLTNFNWDSMCAYCGSPGRFVSSLNVPGFISHVFPVVPDLVPLLSFVVHTVAQ